MRIATLLAVFALSVWPAAVQAQGLQAPAPLPTAQRDAPRWTPDGPGRWQPAAARSAQRTGLASADASPGWDGGYGYTWYDQFEQVALRDDTFFQYDIQFDGDYLYLDDDEAFIVPLGLSSGFPFYGDLYTQVVVNSNGALSFTSTSAVPFGVLGDPSQPNAVIAGYWTDLDPSFEGEILTLNDVEDGREVFVIQWNNVPLSNPFPEAEVFTFQIRLYEDGEIRLLYPNTFFDQVGGAIGIESNDAFHTIDIGAAYSTSAQGFVNGGSQFVIQPPPAGGLTASPYAPTGQALDFVYVTEPCGSQPSRVQEIVVFNTTGAALSVTPSISGAPEFQILSAPSGPVPPGGQGVIEVAFVGRVGSGGTIPSPAVKTATLTLGGANPGSIALEGRTIATTVSPHEQLGGGYRMRTSVAGCNASPAPAAALLPFGTPAGDRPVDIDYGAPDLFALATPFRLYGELYDEVYLNFSGALTFEAPDAEFRLLLDLPPPDTTSAFVAPIAYAYFPDASPAAGPPVPGAAYVGARDVTGDGVDDLVVTYYRVETVFGGYATWQAVLAPSPDPGANGSIRFQYFAGDDPTDGEPYALFYDSNVSVNYRGVAGVSGDQNALSLETRSRTFWAWDIFPATFDRTLESVAVEILPRSQRVLGTGAGPFRAGWRILSAPAAGMTVEALAEQNFVQGIPGAYPTGTGGAPAAPNLFTSYDGATGYGAASGLREALVPGEGIYWYLYDADFLPTLPNGRSQSYALPAPLVASGTPLATTATVPLTAAVSSDGIRWELVGNPFEDVLDVSDLASWASGGALGSGVGQVWDPSTQSYVTTTALGDVIPAWQGMFVEGGTATALQIPPVGVATRTAAPRAVVAFELQGTAADGTPLFDHAALVVSPDAADGRDLLDAAKLGTDGASLTAAFVADGAPRAQEARPDGDPFVVPLAIEGAGTQGTVELRWSGTDAFDPEAQFTLFDTETGDEIDLRETSSYSFELTGNALRRSEMQTKASGPPTPRAARLAATPRFELRVTPGRLVADEDAPTAETFALALVGPNPVRGATTLRLSLPDAASVRASVYDVTGREVTRLLDGPTAAGEHALTLDADRLAPGTYLVRALVGGESATTRVLVLR